jgi:hypothetical protein
MLATELAPSLASSLELTPDSSSLELVFDWIATTFAGLMDVFWISAFFARVFDVFWISAFFACVICEV